MADRYTFEDPRFSPQGQARHDDGAQGDGAPVYVEPPQRGCMKSCLTGCLWGGLVLLILGAVLAWWVSRNWRNWAADIGSQAVKETLRESDLPEAEKAEIQVEVDRLATALREGKLSLQQAAALGQELAESPLATSLMVSVVDIKYLANSGLSDDEKQEARITLRRFARGMIDQKIPEANFSATIEHIADKRGDNWELRDRVSDDELRAFFASAKSDADAAQIVAEPEVVDPSDELKRIIDAALGAAPAMPAEAEDPALEGAPPTEPAEPPSAAEERPAA